MRGNSHVRCGAGEKTEIISNSYLLLYTGNDFIYEDDFTDPIAKYKEITSQATKSNPESMGRFHTSWLNMMYPRLRLAATLLRDDGVCFISIDDNEVHNLRKVCDEVFGEENFKSCISWQKRYTRSNNTVEFTTVIEYILVYSKTSDFNVNLLRRTDEADNRYTNPDDDPRGAWKGASFLNPATPSQRPNLCYPIINPNTGQETYPTTNAWRRSKEIFEQLHKENKLYWGKDGKQNVPAIKMFLSEARGLTPINLWEHEYAGNTDQGTAELSQLLNGKFFDNPKPLTLIKRILEHGSFEDSIILDFFSGSATTAHAVMQLNAEDGGNRQFIMVQLPEVCDEKSEAYKSGYKNICEIGMERIRRSGAKILAEKEEKEKQLSVDGEESKPLDVGFKVFELDTSNLKTWDGIFKKDDDPQLVLNRMNDMLYSVKADRTDLDMVYEIMLKVGLTLTYPVTQIEVQGKKAYVVGDFLLLICLEADITPKMVEGFCEYAPARLIFGEESLQDDDAMSNAYYICKDRDIILKFV